MNKIMRITKVLRRKPSAYGQKIQRAKYLASDDIGRFIPLDRPLDYNPDYSFPAGLKWGSIGVIVLTIAYAIYDAEKEPVVPKKPIDKNKEQPKIKKYIIAKYKSRYDGRANSFYTKFVDY